MFYDDEKNRLSRSEKPNQYCVLWLSIWLFLSHSVRMSFQKSTVYKLLMIQHMRQLPLSTTYALAGSLRARSASAFLYHVSLQFQAIALEEEVSFCTTISLSLFVTQIHNII